MYFIVVVRTLIVMNHPYQQKSIFRLKSHLLTDGINVGATDPVWTSHVVLQIDLLTQVHLTCYGGKNQPFLSPVWHGELYLPIQSPRAEQGGVQCVGAICGHDNL